MSAACERPCANVCTSIVVYFCSGNQKFFAPPNRFLLLLKSGKDRLGLFSCHTTPVSNDNGPLLRYPGR